MWNLRLRLSCEASNGSLAAVRKARIGGIEGGSMKRPHLYVSMSPHVHSGNSTGKMSVITLTALAPVLFAGWFYFGWSALKVVFIGAIAAVAAEYLWQKILKKPITIYDGSALITGILLGFVLSPYMPWWLCALGAVLAIIIGKQLFGGLGNHPFNAALVGWTFLQLSYDEIMSDFAFPEPQFLMYPGEMFVSRPLVTMREEIDMLLEPPWMDLFLGNVPGCIGTVSALAVLLGGGYLLFRRIITWHVPVSFLATVWIFAFILWKIDPDMYVNPTFHILAGWVMLGAFFLAPEKGTCPVTSRGMIFFGIGCGVITMIIRIWGGYVEGVPFAILLMNGATPLLDRLRPKPVGRIREIA
jgi:electron transport complex protein RnfD